MGLYISHSPYAPLASMLFTAFVRLYTRLSVEGREHLPTEGAFILAANHTSHADTAAIFAALPPQLRQRFVAAAARDYFFKGDRMQLVARMLYNVIPVDRDISRGRDPLRHVVRALRQGYGVLLYPEGTRSSDGSLGRFRSGIGRLMAQFPGMPVVPTWLSGTTNVLPKGASVPRPAKVTIHFGPPLRRPIQPGRASELAAARELREAVLALQNKANA